MNRSTLMILALGTALVATPARAQQPLEPQPAAPYPNPAAPPSYDSSQYSQQYGQPAPPPQYDPQAQPDPYATDDDEDDGYDVTYDVTTEQEQQAYDDGYDPNAYQQFESTLAPYGAWQDVPSYGHVWVPSPSVVGVDFAPYGSGGHFVMSDYGWTWASDWDWGWAPFHYGRWLVVGGHGWCWIPGTVWGPAWVNWRWGGGYVGWAPMAPRGVVIGPPRGIRGPWHFTVAGQLGVPRPAYLPARVVPSVWARTTTIHNVANVRLGGAAVRVNAGPPAHLVAAATGRTIAPAPLASVAPHALPRTAIAPRVGMPLQSRPWMQSRPVGGAYAHPVPGAHTIAAPRPLGPTSAYPAYRAPYAQPYHPPTAPVYRSPAPVYRGPVQTYQPYRPAPAPVYHYPTPAYHATPAPVYHYAPPAPAYHYAPPAPAYHYSAPAPAYHYSAPAPTFHSAPAPTFHSAPAPAFHGGGGGHFGGRR
jgi:hypothetical protein